MTRVVVLGPYPPASDPAADVVLDAVRALRADGHTVTVVSTEPSAAPAWGDPTRASGARRVARALRGADRVIWFASDAAAAAGPAAPLRRALGTAAVVERRAIATVPVPSRSWADRAARLRAGAPTYSRTVLGRVRRALRRGSR